MMTETPALLEACPHCAASQAALYRDTDGAACLVCGWRRYDWRPARTFAEKYERVGTHRWHAA